VREHLDETKEGSRVQIFATDIDAQSIERARGGLYPESIAADVSPERLARFFTHENSSYRISKSIRDMVVFAKQDLLKDPPSLILTDHLPQSVHLPARRSAEEAAASLHYALNQDGYLFLGDSETIGESSDLFEVIDKKWRIYQRKGMVTLRAKTAPYLPATAETAVHTYEPASPTGVRDLAERCLLDVYVPAGC